MTEHLELLNTIFWIGTVLFFALALSLKRIKWIKHVMLAVPIVMVGLFATCGEWNSIRDLINWLLGPERLLLFTVFLLVLAMLYYQQWTKPWVAGPLIFVFACVYFISAFDDDFFLILTKPDNVPITVMIFAVAFFVWLGFRQMALNDTHMTENKPLIEAEHTDRVFTWPDLVYVELIGILLVSVVLIAWAILVRAPLEQPANPRVVPNPSKAPWYFVGLQELMVYFDPWIAGVLLPVLIILGLCALPYLDKNPKGNGYYTLKERPLAIGIFLMGFLVLWVLLIVLGTFFRGPNWNFFGPYEPWDPHRAVTLTNVHLAEYFWVHWLGSSLPTFESAGTGYYYLRELPGLVALVVYFLLIPFLLKTTVFKRLYMQMGFIRYSVMMVLLTWMGLIPIKMLLRWLFDLKYILAIPEWGLNV